MGKKKYIIDSKGGISAVATDNLGLEKPLLNENYNIDVHNRNMDRIDEDLKPIDDSYIIELFQHDGDTTRPRDYYTKEEMNLRLTDIEANINDLKEEVNGQRLRGIEIANSLLEKL